MILSLKVENHVVGAPCGVMDQMTSACGEANKLLAMVCQVLTVDRLCEALNFLTKYLTFQLLYDCVAC